MRLTLDIDMDALGPDAVTEAGRILRYWAGALGQMDLNQQQTQPLMDSTAAPVGSIAVGHPPADGDAKSHLHRYLQRLHQALLWKLDGLTERDARWPMTPTGTNLLGLLKHVASVEAEYFGQVFGRPCPQVAPWADDDAANADMWATAQESIASIREFAEQVWAHADATIEALDLDAPGHVPWWGERGDVTLAHVLVHVVTEVARHAGHADIVRELTDGAAGLSDRASNLPDADAQWWAAYVSKLQAEATAAQANSGA